jgi:hypothetical protein
MRFKVVVLALVALFATSAIASAQSQTGEIFGKVTDGGHERNGHVQFPAD